MSDMAEMPMGHKTNFSAKLKEVSNILTICCIVFALTVLLPLCIRFVYPLFKKRRDILLQKRHINLSLLAIIYLLSQLVAENLNCLFDFDILYPMKHGQSVGIIQFIIISIYCFTVTGFITITFVRFFLVYFDIKYNVLIANDEWKSIIDHNHNKNQTSNFFIKYRSTLGSENWWFKFIIIDTIIAAIISPILAWYKLDDLLYIHNGIFYIAFIIIYFKLRRVKFWDDFCIVSELRRLGIAIIFLIAIWCSLRGSAEIIKIINRDQMDFKHELWMICYLYSVYIISMLYDVYVVYLTSRWVIKKLETDPALNLHYKNRSGVFSGILNNFTPTLSLTPTKSEQSRKGSRKMTDSNASKPICLKQILKTSEYLECFIHHLSREFSMECVLAYIEFMQFKQYVQSKQDALTGLNFFRSFVYFSVIFKNLSCE